MKLLNYSSNFSARQFGIFRIVFGSYLIWHFACLIPYGVELFSDVGLLGDRSINPFYGSWPNPLFLEGSAHFMTPWLIAAVVASGLFTVGWMRRSSALFLWFTWSCLFTANPLIANPSLAYVGLLLLFCTLIPLGDAFVWRIGESSKLANPQSWKMPGMVCVTAWLLMSVGYTFSGILKCQSPSWIDGTAIRHLMENPLARPGWMRDVMLALPDPMLQTMTWGVLLLEIFFLPLILFKTTRIWAWSAMVLMHFGIMTTVDFADLSLGMLMIHLFTFQSSWLSKLKWRPASSETTSSTHSSPDFTQPRPVRSRLLPANER
ncbi:MAG: HTTM domain-containing protein [Verrucomicrobiota bacterium]